MDIPFIYLASKSPRRQELLHQVGLEFTLVDSEIDESPSGFQSIQAYAEAMSLGKAKSAYETLDCPLKQNEVILAADTTIGYQQQILGKPRDFSDFKIMMDLLSDATHFVYSSICLLNNDRYVQVTNRSEVSLSELSEDFIEAYWKTGEPCDKAGGYAIQGLMASFIREIRGSYSGIMGLPLYELRDALLKLGYNYPLLNTKLMK